MEENNESTATLEPTSPTNTDVTSPSIRDFVQQEALSLMTQSVTLNNQIKTAKTNYKKEYFLKKLKKNNKKALQMVTALTRMTEAKKARDNNVIQELPIPTETSENN